MAAMLDPSLVQPGERAAQAGQQVRGGVAVLHIGGRDDHPDRQADRIGQKVPLAALDHLLRRISARSMNFPDKLGGQL
jgi:hypothetical protein